MSQKIRLNETADVKEFVQPDEKGPLVWNIQENSKAEKRPVFCRDKREDDIYV